MKTQVCIHLSVCVSSNITVLAWSRTNKIMGRKSCRQIASKSKWIAGGTLREFHKRENEGQVSLDDEETLLHKKIDELDETIANLKESHEKLRMANSHLEADIIKKSEQIKQLQTQLAAEQRRNQHLQANIQKEQAAHEDCKRTRAQWITNAAEDHKLLVKEEMDNLKKSMLSLTPTRGKRIKVYRKVTDRHTKMSRFRRVIEFIEEFVGKDDADLFISDFVNFVANCDSYKFSFKLSPWDSFYVTIKFGLSDEFLKQFKKICKTRIGFDILADGREVHAPCVVAFARDVPNLLRRRLERLSRSKRLVHDDGTAGEIVIGVGGDKGADVTKMCMILENVDKPNNPHSIQMLGLYHGHDDNQNLHAKLGPLFDQLNNLHSISYTENDVEVTKKIRIKPIGDLKFLSALFGHSGQSSSSPCPVCNQSWTKSGRNKALLSTFCFEEVGAPRTLTQLLREGRPLLHVEPELAGPPALHTIMGITQSYVIDPLVARCNQIDYPFENLPADLPGQRAALKRLKTEKETYDERVNGLIEAQKLIQCSVDAFVRMDQPSRGRSRSNPKCKSPFCLINSIPQNYSKMERFLCSICDEQFHVACSGFFTPDQCFSAKKCLMCSKKSEFSLHFLQNNAKLQLEAIQKKLDEDDGTLKEVDFELTVLKEQMEKSAGPTRKQFEQVLESIGCDGRIWYQSLVGKQVRTLLRTQNIEKVLSIFTPDEQTDGMRRVMRELSLLMSNANNAVKSDDDIDQVECSIGRFVIAIREAHPTMGVTPKLHLLAAHLVPYMRVHKTWGRMTEQGIESLHAIYNTLRRRYASVRDPTLQVNLILQQLANLNVMFDCGDSWLDEE
uniref:Zinc finger PHD-type domain-containing protein n=1 Tax=Caenorhabditis japonica TaxID=281687 RepID=A0A8R1HTU1_CAEJA